MDWKTFWTRQRGRILIALAITCLGLVLRVNLAMNGPIEWDEPVYLDAAVLYAHDIRTGDWHHLLTTTYNYEHPILFKVFYGAVLALRSPAPDLNGGNMGADGLIKNSPYYPRLLSLRLVSVGFGALAVFLLSLINPLAGLFFAIQTLTVKYTSVIYLESLPLMLSLLSVSAYTHVRTIISANSRLSRGQIAWLLLSAVSLGLAVASKFIYGLAGLAILIDALVLGWPRLGRTVRWAALWGGLTLVCFLAADPVVLADPFGHFLGSIQYSVDYSQHDYSVRQKAYPFWQPLKWLALSITRQSTTLEPFFLRPGNFWIALDELFLPLAALGAWRLARKHRTYAIWLAVGLVFLLLWNTKWPQYTLAIMPPYCLSAALGLEEIAGWVNKKYLISKKTPTS